MHKAKGNDQEERGVVTSSWNISSNLSACNINLAALGFDLSAEFTLH